MRLTAETIAGTPDHYYDAVIIGKNIWECTGYSRTGNTVRFSRLIESPIAGELHRHALIQINIYVRPDRWLTIKETK